MPPYLDTLIMKLTGLLRNGQKIVQEGALTAMASVADCAKSHFVNYYSQAITLPSHAAFRCVINACRLTMELLTLLCPSFALYRKPASCRLPG